VSRSTGGRCEWVIMCETLFDRLPTGYRWALRSPVRVHSEAVHVLVHGLFDGSGQEKPCTRTCTCTAVARAQRTVGARVFARRRITLALVAQRVGDGPTPNPAHTLWRRPCIRRASLSAVARDVRALRFCSAAHRPTGSPIAAAAGLQAASKRGSLVRSCRVRVPGWQTHLRTPGDSPR
jgi:hypothetical protein